MYFPYLADYSKRFEVYYGGAGSGKSVFISQKLIYKLLKYENRKCLVVRRIGNSLRDSCFSLIKSTLGNWGIYNECKINKTDLTIELPNGSIFIFKGLDDEERLKSIDGITDIWVEEATEIDSFKFDQLDLRLRSKEPFNQIFISFNPVSKENWVYKRWFLNGGEYDRDNTRVLKTTYRDNRFLPQSYIESLMNMKRSNPAYYAIYAEGEFASLDKLIYTNWKVEVFDYIEILRSVKDSKAIFSLDFGYTNDPTAFVCSIIDETNKRIWVYDGFNQKGLLNDEIARKIIEMGYRKEIIICDSAEPKSIDELKKHGLFRAKGALKGKDSIINGINLLQQYEIIIHPQCNEIQEELKNYTWKKSKLTGEYINEPIDKYNHCLDSLRYGVTTTINGRIPTVKLLDRSLFF